MVIRRSISKLSFVLLLVGITAAASAQNLDSLSQQARERYLITEATKVVKKYGPDYYREYKVPDIDRLVENDGKYAGTIFYCVTFPYDTAKEEFDKGYAATVTFYAKTAKMMGVVFGNGYYISFDRWEKYNFNGDDVIVPYQRKRKSVHRTITHPDGRIEHRMEDEK
jgi:hypothetical protein